MSQLFKSQSNTVKLEKLNYKIFAKWKVYFIRQNAPRNAQNFADQISMDAMKFSVKLRRILFHFSKKTNSMFHTVNRRVCLAVAYHLNVSHTLLIWLKSQQTCGSICWIIFISNMLSRAGNSPKVKCEAWDSGEPEKSSCLFFISNLLFVFTNKNIISSKTNNSWNFY